MAKRRNRRRYRRGRKKNTGIVSTLIVIAAVVVFCVSGFRLYNILNGYHKGEKEYDKVRELAVVTQESDADGEEAESRFAVDFAALKEINPDTVGWIRFDPEPAQINYPLVQTNNNDLYLNKTFSANENTVGAIFVNYQNKPDFNDRNTIIYGHRMKDNSMFHDLEKYKEKSFWEVNPYFYIYTPDGREITYHIYSAGVVEETSDTYLTEFFDDAAYEKFLQYTIQAGDYDTGAALTTEDKIVTLSTCTAASDEHRMVVRGVKESEKKMQ